MSFQEREWHSATVLCIDSGLGFGVTVRVFKIDAAIQKPSHRITNANVEDLNANVEGLNKLRKIRK